VGIFVGKDLEVGVGIGVFVGMGRVKYKT